MTDALRERLHDLATSANPALRRQAYAFACDLDLPEEVPGWRVIDDEVWVHASGDGAEVEGYETAEGGEGYPVIRLYLEGGVSGTLHAPSLKEGIASLVWNEPD